MGEGENSREAGDDGGNHDYKDGGQKQEREDKQEEKGSPAVGAAVPGSLQQLTLRRENSKVRPGMSSCINIHSTGMGGRAKMAAHSELPAFHPTAAHSLPLLRCSSQYTDPSLSLRTGCPPTSPFSLCP